MLQIGNPTAINLPVAVQKGKVGMDVTTGQQLGLRPGVIHGHAWVSEGPATYVSSTFPACFIPLGHEPQGVTLPPAATKDWPHPAFATATPRVPAPSAQALWGFKVSGCPRSSPPLCHHQGVTEMSGLSGVTGAQQQPPSPSLGLLLPLFKVTSGQLLEGFKLSSVGAQSKEEMSSINPARGYGADGTLALGPSCS